MIDLTKISSAEANKIECALLQMENDFIGWINCCEQLSTDKDLSAESRKTFASNAKWWKEVHDLIYGGE